MAGADRRHVPRLPGISGPMGDRRTARIVGTLGLLLENGVALPTALKILRDVLTRAGLRCRGGPCT